MLRREFDYQEPNPKQIEKILSNHGGIHLQVKNSPENQYWVPKVLNSDSILQSEYKDSWKHYITKQNERDCRQSRGNREIRFMFYGVKIVECIFIICNLLKQPPEVKYLAVEILDRFLIIHFFQTLDQAERTGRNKFEWEEILNTVLSQAFLRIMSAIQLAAKYCCNSKDVSVTSLQKLMNSIGRDRYSKKVILQSEARVYQTLNFNIPVVSPLTFIEMFFEDFSNLKREINFSISLHKFFEVSIDVLDVAVAYHKDIYEKIWFQVKNGEDQTLEDKLEFLSIEGDYTYLASGVIWTAASIIDPKSAFVDRIIDFLCYLTFTKYHKLKIEMLGNLILEKILS